MLALRVTSLGMTRPVMTTVLIVPRMAATIAIDVPRPFFPSGDPRPLPRGHS